MLLKCRHASARLVTTWESDELLMVSEPLPVWPIYGIGSKKGSKLRLDVREDCMSNIAYYQRRELEEIELATIANDPRARRVHEGLARKYARLARQEPGKRVASFELTAPAG